MFENPKLTDIDLVACEFCLKEVPKSEAQSADAWDYVAYFCGPKCYEEWVAEQMEERTREAGEP